LTQEERLDRLTNIVESLAASVVAHDNQIEALIKVAGKHAQDLNTLRKQ